MKIANQNMARLDAVIEPMLRAARIPGGALAVVAGGKTVYAQGFGYRDLKAKNPVTADTVYPIASTTKAMNATLLAMLVEEGRLEWDAPVQRYLPHFRLHDAAISPRVTLRDLVAMRTGLPRHDWAWSGNTQITRAGLVERFAHLTPSADFRLRYQYNNLTVTLSGHIAEVVTGKSWEALVQERLFRPLGMRHTRFAAPARGNATLSYHENARRKLLLSKRLAADVTAPSGGSVHSTVADMARWLAFNLNGGKVNRRRVMGEKALAQLHTPQVVIGDRSLTAQPPDANYGLGWAIHHYNGHKRVWHGGYVFDVASSVMFFPDEGIGMVCFINFGYPGIADLINQYAFDTLKGLKPAQTLEQRLELYETKIKDARKRNAAVAREKHTRPSHPLDAYVGKYEHPGYGEVRIRRRRGKLILQRYEIAVPLKHWHYDVWVGEEDSDTWPIHMPHPFDRANPIQFHMGAQGGVACLTIALEPEVAPLRFEKRV